MNPIHWRYCSYRELQSDADEISVADRFAIVKALKMNDIQEFLIWQRKLLERQMGRSGIDAANQSITYAGHYALGTQAELNLLRNRLKKRGLFSYTQYLGLDPEGDPLRALDLCSKRYALQREKHLSQQPEPVAV